MEMEDARPVSLVGDRVGKLLNSDKVCEKGNKNIPLRINVSEQKYMSAILLCDWLKSMKCHSFVILFLNYITYMLV